MSRAILLSTLGLSAALVGYAVQGCSSSSSPAAATDSGTPIDSSTPADTGTSPDSGGTTTPDSGGTTTPDAGPWAPSNITTTGSAANSIASILTGTLPTVDIGTNCTGGTADTDTGLWSCGNGSLLDDGGTQAIPYVQVQLSGAGGTATVWAMSSLTLITGNSLTITGAKPAIFYVTGAVQLSGAVTVTAGNQTAGPGTGTNPAATPLFAPGGAGYCGAGGSGAALADAGTATGAGGPANGSATLIPLLGGYPGGGDGSNSSGGAGGGALQITALGGIAIPGGGSILCAGQVGDTNNGFYGGGGGSGGAILLEGPSVAINGSLSVNGGSGSASGAAGNSGALGTSQALGAGGGGAGGAGTVAAGGNGTGGNGASGGGGVGYIRINSASPTLTGTFSPDLGDAGGGCTTVGPL